ncbi:MAG: 2,3-diphosphoglycerate-dependent phosphoglycerate mutase [Gammaproteobacteria bacterium]|nr:2,3-diphosphoglycerate-dependent phosphoglycerate mutase [Gammaproteobacteria bacterium]
MKPSYGRLVLCRHGESLWNRENRFTGWTDVDLSPAGEEEASRAGRLLRGAGLVPEVAHTSVLTRAVRTLSLMLAELECSGIKVHRHWRLNERHYGALQGLNKAETMERHGEAQVKIWRRSYAIPPPALEPDDPRHPRHDARYAGVHAPPAAESLKDTLERVQPCWESRIAPDIEAGRCTLVSAHGNSLRALVKLLENISDDDIVRLEIPTGAPLLYEFGPGFTAQPRRYVGEIP